MKGVSLMGKKKPTWLIRGVHAKEKNRTLYASAGEAKKKLNREAKYAASGRNFWTKPASDEEIALLTRMKIAKLSLGLIRATTEHYVAQIYKDGVGSRKFTARGRTPTELMQAVLEYNAPAEMVSA